METDPIPLVPQVAPNAVVGWELRWLLTLMLMDHGDVMSIPEMVHQLEREGYSVPERASRVVSDALRLEIHKGRVRRVSRGRYSFVGMPKSTRSRFRARARAVRELRAFATVRRRAVMPWHPEYGRIAGY